MSDSITQPDVLDVMENLESGSYITEDSRVEPLRVCEQQPYGLGTVATVSTKGTVYVFSREGADVRKYRGSSIRDDLDEMANDGRVRTMDVVHEPPEPRVTPDNDEFQYAAEFSRPRAILVQEWCVGRLTSAWREDYEWKFSPLPFDESYEAQLRTEGLFIDGQPATVHGSRVSLMLRDWL